MIRSARGDEEPADGIGREALGHRGQIRGQPRRRFAQCRRLKPNFQLPPVHAPPRRRDFLRRRNRAGLPARAESPQCDQRQYGDIERPTRQFADPARFRGLAPDELKRAKAKVIGQKKISRQDLGGYAMASALDELYGLGYANADTEDAKYEAVTVEDTRAAARKFLRTDAHVITVIQP